MNTWMLLQIHVVLEGFCIARPQIQESKRRLLQQAAAAAELARDADLGDDASDYDFDAHRVRIVPRLLRWPAVVLTIIIMSQGFQVAVLFQLSVIMMMGLGCALLSPLSHQADGVIASIEDGDLMLTPRSRGRVDDHLELGTQATPRPASHGGGAKGERRSSISPTSRSRSAFQMSSDLAGHGVGDKPLGASAHQAQGQAPADLDRPALSLAQRARPGSAVGHREPGA